MMLLVMVGVFYVAYKCLFELIGSVFATVIPILGIAAALYLSSVIGNYSDSAIFGIAALIFLLMFVIGFMMGNLYTGLGLAVASIALFSPILLISGIFSIPFDQNPWTIIATLIMAAIVYAIYNNHQLNKSGLTDAPCKCEDRESNSDSDILQHELELEIELVTKELRRSTNLPEKYFGVWVEDKQFRELMRNAIDNKRAEPISDFKLFNIMKEVSRRKGLPKDTSFKMRESMIYMHRMIYGNARRRAK